MAVRWRFTRKYRFRLKVPMVALTGEVHNPKAGAQAAKPRSAAIIVAIDCLAGRGALSTTMAQNPPFKGEHLNHAERNSLARARKRMRRRGVR